MAFATGTNIKCSSGELGTIVDVNSETGVYSVAIKNAAGEMTGLKTFHSEAELKDSGWTEA